MLRIAKRETVIADGELILQKQLDELAVCIHEQYLRERIDDGEKIGDRPALQHFQNLAPLYQDDNRA